MVIIVPQSSRARGNFFTGVTLEACLHDPYVWLVRTDRTKDGWIDGYNLRHLNPLTPTVAMWVQL